MSITVTTDVFCDQCGDWVFGIASHKIENKKARLNAKKQGWLRIKNQDICPSCKEKI